MASFPETYLRSFINDLGLGSGNNGVDVIVATSGQTAFSLTHTPLSAPIVYINNSLKSYLTDYTISGSTVTMTVGLTLNDVFKAVYNY